MKTLKVLLPDEIFEFLNAIENQKENFVLEAIKEKMERETKRSFGLSKGNFVVPEDFDASLPEDVLADFEN